jgi:hypothetical protein
MALVDGRTVRCRHVVGIYDVLDAERHAMQRATDPTSVQGASLRDDVVCIEILPCLHRGFAHRNVFETGASHGFTGGVAAAYSLDDVHRCQCVERLRQSIRAHPVLPLAGVSLPCHQDVTRFREHAAKRWQWQGAASATESLVAYRPGAADAAEYCAWRRRTPKHCQCLAQFSTRKRPFSACFAVQ